MGTPQFAVPCLAALCHAADIDVVGVVTSPDKAAGRGQHLQGSAVKKYALEQGLPILQPGKLRDPIFLEQLHDLRPDLQVVVAFRMLPTAVFELPPLGTINLHASLLPQYRGAAPINWAIINGERETGLTTFFIGKEIDTGNIIAQTRMPIGEHETAGELHDRMMVTGTELLLQTVFSIAQGKCPSIPQSNSPDLRPAPKIFSDTCRINWHKTPHEVCNLIRGLSPYPAALAQLNGKTFKVLKARPIVEEHGHSVGKIVSDHRRFLHVAVPGGYVELLEVQPESKRAMSVQDFLNGNKQGLEVFL